MKRLLCLVLFVLTTVSPLTAQQYAPLPEDPYFAPFKPLQSTPTQGLLLERGDRLAICGDSITEQKMYSRIMETYLTEKARAPLAAAIHRAMKPNPASLS